MRITKTIRGVLTIAGAASIAWGALVGPAKADDAPVQAAETSTSTTLEPTTTTTTTTIASTTTTTVSSTTTTVVTPGDPDGDGVSNEPAVDFFDDGVTADQDPTVAIVGTGTDAVVIALDVDGDEELRNVTRNMTTRVGNVVLPDGFVSFNVVNASGPVDVVTAWADKDPKAHALYKGTASSMAAFPTTETQFEDGVAVFNHRIVDGGAGDADRTVNGTIVDPIGPGYTVAATTATTTRASTLPRTGGGMTGPAATGFAAIVVGLLLLAVAWKPAGAHYAFDK